MSAFPDSKTAAAEREEMLAIFFLRNAEANRLVFYRSAAGRAYRMWIESALPWPEDIEHPDDFCARKFGTSMRRFMAICLAPAYARVDSVHPSPEEAVFDPEAYFERSELDPELCARVLSELTYTDRLPASIVDDQATYWAFADMAATPYLKSSATTLVPCSVTRVFERGTTGVFWLLHASLSGKQERLNRLTSHFGHMFERYCLELAVESARTGTEVEGEIEYERAGSRGLVRSSDVLVSSLGKKAPSRAFFECSAIRPTQGLYTEASLDAFRKYVENLIRKLEQLDRTIRDHLDGAFALGRDLAGSNDTYIPVLVVDEPFQWTNHLRNVIESRLAEKGLFTHVNVARPIICDIGEYEHLWASVSLLSRPEKS